MAYAHIQMFLYRPFLHYASQAGQAENVDKRSYACAAACVSVSRNIVHVTDQMKRKGLLVGSYWFYMYTTFFAIMSLVFYILENSRSPRVEDILKDAYEGKSTLAALAAKSRAADRCSKILAVSFIPSNSPAQKLADSYPRSSSTSCPADCIIFETIPCGRRGKQPRHSSELHHGLSTVHLSLLRRQR